MMDAGQFYALLRLEEASLALRAVLALRLVEQMGERSFSHDQLRDTLGFTEQAARTFFALLRVMGILEREQGDFRLSKMASHTLADQLPSSRKPYLQMGSGPEVVALVGLLRGEHAPEARPLYSPDDGTTTLMDEVEVGREIAFGLSSRARNFAYPLAAAIAKECPQASTLVDIGAGSPYVGQACLQTLPGLKKVQLLDRANGMQFMQELIQREGINSAKIELLTADFFRDVPAADIYVLSNTAHDWRPEEYRTLIENIRHSMKQDGVICIHEPLLLDQWNSDREWYQALWMACYAMTLLKLTLGAGTCYSIEEHHAILAQSGMRPSGSPQSTVDGCTALFYEGPA